MIPDTQTLRWLLKDKYGWNSQEIERAIEDDHFVYSLQVQQDIERLKAGEPLAYVIGWVHFLGCVIDLTRRPLIPRPETEAWVEEVIKKYAPHSETLRVLDLCCGSGCIGIALLKHLPHVTVNFVDIDSVALQQTRENLEKNHIRNRFTLTQSDLFAQVTGQYDLIVSNPPYVDPLSQHVPELAYEPDSALYADDHGLACIRRIISALPNFLTQRGRAYLEFGKGQEPAIADMLSAIKCTHYAFLPDQYQVLRYVEIINE